MSVTKKNNKIEAGGLRLENELWLAPLAGVTTPPVREFFALLGAGLTHTEMVSCMGLLRDNRKTEKMLRLLPGEDAKLGTPVILQLFAGDADTMTKGAEAALGANARLGPSRFAALGINMACPMPKVTKRGAGAALMGTETALTMVRSLKSLELPIWVKIRRMPDDLETLRFVEGLVEAGADNVCIHGRTSAQRYEGRAERRPTAMASARFPGKISASGDVYALEDVNEYLNMGCVGVMLARGALANPYLFPMALQTLGYEIPSDLTHPSWERRTELLRNLGNRAREICGEKMALVLLKRLIAGVFKNMPGTSELRRRANSASDLAALLSCCGDRDTPFAGL